MNFALLLVKFLPTLCRFFRWVSQKKPHAATVLIVDDDPEDADLVQLRLEKRGLLCEVCTSGEVAAGLVKHSHYSAIIVDMRLPGMSGEALLRILSTEAPSSKLVIVCGDSADLGKVSSGQFVSFIRKPVNQKSIDAMLASIKL